MRSGNWTLGLLGAAALAATGCTTAQSASEERPSPTASAQDKSQQAMERAVDAQKRASDLEQASQSAQSKVAEKQRDLADAQAEAQAARERAADAQKSANIQREQANNQAETAQADALKAQKTESTEAKNAAQTVEGRVTGMNGDNIIIYRGDATPLQLKVDGKTQITLDGRKVKAGALPQGADVKAAFVPGQVFPHATKLEATSPVSPSSPDAPNYKSPSGP